MTKPATGLALAARGLVKRYGAVQAVRGLDLEVRSGECFGLLGPNGAGKTTTIEILEGLLAPTAGEVEVLGRRWSDAGDELRQRLGITLQETHLPDKLTVEENLQLFRSFYRDGRSVDEVLRLVSLEDKRGARYETLSGGQKQRLAVACALVGRPELLFLDEPTTGLDPQSRRQLWELVEGFRAGGGTVLLTTHYMEEAERLCDRVAIVDHGQRIALGTPRELVASLGGRHVVELGVDGHGVDADALGLLPGVHAVRALPGGFALTVGEVHRALPPLLQRLEAAGAPLTRLSTHHATLEDVFVTLTGRQLRE
jgi:ABC-2 type transport system ATP-binding protein